MYGKVTGEVDGRRRARLTRIHLTSVDAMDQAILAQLREACSAPDARRRVQWLGGTTMSQPTRILILGGGFGGVYTALTLEKTPEGRDPPRRGRARAW